MSTIVVFGATGYAGGNISRELASRGHRVVAVSRSITPDQAPEGGEARPGSIADADFVRDVTRGADAIVSALHGTMSDGAKLVSYVPLLLEAAADAGARLGVVGGAGSLHAGSADGPIVADLPTFPEAFQTEARSLGEVLDALRASDTEVDWFFLSPAGGFGSYNPGERRGTYRVGGDVLIVDDEGESNISGEDYGIAFADEIERPAHHRARFTVAY